MTALSTYGFEYLPRPLAVLLSGKSRKTFDKYLRAGHLCSIGGRKKLITLASLEAFRGTEVSVPDYLAAVLRNTDHYGHDFTTPPLATARAIPLITHSEAQVALARPRTPGNATDGPIRQPHLRKTR